jgi:hypothetical protein
LNYARKSMTQLYWPFVLGAIWWTRQAVEMCPIGRPYTIAPADER